MSVSMPKTSRTEISSVGFALISMSAAVRADKLLCSVSRNRFPAQRVVVGATYRREPQGEERAAHSQAFLD